MNAKARYKAAYILLYLFSYEFVPPAVRVVLSGLRVQYDLTVPVEAQGIAVNLSIYAFLAVTAVLLFRDQLEAAWKKFSVSSFFRGIGFGVLLMVFEAAGAIAASRFFHHQGTTTNQASLNGLFTFSPIPIVIMSVLLAPLVEELIFRWIILDSTKGFLGKVPALLISSALFALVHISGLDPYSITVYSCLGIGFGLCFLRDDNYFENVLIHAFNNAMVISFMFAGLTRS